MNIRGTSLVLGLVVLGAGALLALPTDARGDEDKPRDGTTHARHILQPPAQVAAAVDTAVRLAWEQEGLTPTARCSDDEFVRRVFLDLIGTVPSSEQVARFLTDEHPKKRARLVDALLESPGYARNFAEKWGAVLVGEGNGSNQREFTPGAFRQWLERQLLADRPFDELVTEMVAATGTVYTNPAVNFSGRRGHNPTDVAGAVSKAFLGVQIQCAQCHDHPYEEISQKDFQGVAAFFARVNLRGVPIPYDDFGERGRRAKQNQLDRLEKGFLSQGKSPEEARRMAEQRLPKSRELSDISPSRPFPRRAAERMKKRLGEVATAEPRFLLSGAYEEDKETPRRAALAAWIADTENPYTARALANRYWGWLLGRGIVHPVDDFSSVNIPAVPEALLTLTEDTAASGFDTKRLIRVITATEAYQLSTQTADRTPLAEEFFAAGPLKQLRPQQVFDSLQVALGVADEGTSMTGLDGTAYSALESGRGGMMMGMGYADARDVSARRLRNAAREFFRTFDDDEAEESEGFSGTIPQGLMWMNSGLINDLITNPKHSVVPGIVERHDSTKDRIRDLFVRTLSRQPTREELTRFSKFVADQSRHAPAAETTAKQRRKKKNRKGRKMTKEATAHAAYADVLWVLISSSEFATNH